MGSRWGISPGGTAVDRIADFTYRRAKVIIAIVVILNLASLASFFRFHLETDFLALFSQGNPRAEEYSHLNQKYHSGEAISILMEGDGSLLDKDSMLRVFRLQERAKAIEGVSQVQSFIPPQVMLRGRLIPVTEGLIEGGYETLRSFLEDRYFLTDQFLAPDGRSGVLVVTMEVDAPSREVLGALKEMAGEETQLSLSLAGNEVIKDTLWSYLVRILLILPPAAIIVVLLVFFGILRDGRLAILAMVPAGLAALWTFGTIFWSGRGLSLVTVLSPLFVIVIGSAYGLHYVSHFQDNLPRSSDRRELALETFRMVGTPIFLATITTMAGFASLTWTEVIPMRQMGIFVTLGIGYAGFMALLFLPAVLSRVGLPSRQPGTGESRLSRLVVAVSRRRAPTVAAFLAIVAVSAFYIPRLEVVSNQLMFFKPGSEIRQTFEKVEEHFGGAMPLTGEVASPAGPAALWDAEFAERVLATERALEDLHGIDSVFSIFDLLKGVNRMSTGQDVYPQSQAMVQGLLMQLGEGERQSWVSQDGFRMVIRTRNLAPGDMGRVEDFVNGNRDTLRLITGMPVLFDEMNRLVVRSQAQSLGLALALIFAMLLLILRSLRAALAGLLPIAITIVAILGMLSLTGFQLNVMTATLSAIAIGVGVDYSIHLISGIHYFRRQGLDAGQSVDRALSSVSRPVLANAFGLAAGLSVLFFSPLQIHFQAASVMWVAMVVSSSAALLLVPLLYSRVGWRGGG
jgi:hypothetical protein